MAQIFVSVVAHFFMSVGGSKFHERLAHFFIDIYTGVCVLGALFVAVLGYIALTFLFLGALDSPPLDESTASGKVLSEKQATVEEHKTPVPVPLDYEAFLNT